MTCEETLRRLDDYVDGELPPAARRRLEEHLTACPGCRRRLEATRELLRRARSLDKGVAPKSDLWPGIAERLDTVTRLPAAATRQAPDDAGIPTRRWLAAAAALLLVGLSLPLVTQWWSRSRGRTALSPSVASEAPAPVSIEALAALARAEDGVLQTHRDLHRSMARQRAGIAPDTLRDIETSARLLDTAIGELREALEHHPEDAALRHQLAARYQQEAALSRRLSRTTASV